MILVCNAVSPRKRGFTILEIMISMAIFMMVMASVYAVWSSILRGSEAGLKAAANAQRSRVAMRTLHDALLTTVSHPENLKHYTFLAESSGDFADIRFTARLPSSFPGVGRYGGSIVRRVRFTVEPGASGNNELVLYQQPLLTPQDRDFNPYRLVLSPDVSLFTVEFFDALKAEYTREWKQTNSIPRLVRVAIGMGKGNGRSAREDIAATTIAVPATRVGTELQRNLPAPGRIQ
ncbi:MAG: prepilin-type N-terminal cleavage/methylation domain-containing protein [Verrucomicrobia bacterium]|nr:prepilin-type N-terminal cleavage/methylation domain-containing protein [Verrucomicrobiota bacterium]MBI3871041.1 prepilin-type N-terminal cleavage/methylation domain-containing protein [Verrucomicrobiota bacterium]